MSAARPRLRLSLVRTALTLVLGAGDYVYRVTAIYLCVLDGSQRRERSDPCVRRHASRLRHSGADDHGHFGSASLPVPVRDDRLLQPAGLERGELHGRGRECDRPRVGHRQGQLPGPCGFPSGGGDVATPARTRRPTPGRPARTASGSQTVTALERRRPDETAHVHGHPRHDGLRAAARSRRTAARAILRHDGTVALARPTSPTAAPASPRRRVNARHCDARSTTSAAASPAPSGHDSRRQRRRHS